MKIIFLVILIIIVALLQWWSSNNVLTRLEAMHKVPNALVEPGEEFAIFLSFENKSRIFIPFLRYKLYLPREFSIHTDPKNIHIDVMDRQYITGTTWLGPRQHCEKQILVSASKRGCYLLKELIVYGGDFLGLNETPKTFGNVSEIVVYPKEISSPEISQVFGGFLGDVSVKRFIHEDPVLVLGFREYTGREPMKMISWTQSAKSNSLMVKNYDYTLEPSVSVILNVDGGSECTGEDIETCFSLARSVCADLEDKGIKYDFRMNAVTISTVQSQNYFTEGLGSAHFYGILEQLGRSTQSANVFYPVMLEKSIKVSSVSSHGIIFITPGINPEEADTAKRFAEQTGNTLLTLTSRGSTIC